MLLRITGPTFVVGLVFLEGSDVAYRVAPLVSYMRGWTTHRIWAYCTKRKWHVERIE